MKKIIITLILLIMGAIPIYYFLRWSDYVTSGTLEVNNISKDTVFLAINKSIVSNKAFFYTLHIQGEVDDDIKINDYYTMPKGKIDSNILVDYHYRDSIYVKYKANNAKKGHLKIKYKFHVY